MVPEKIKSGLDAIKAEEDDQENDLLKVSMVDDANGDMVDLKSELMEEGLSEDFADNFSSLENIMDFISEILSGPYSFEETIDEKQVSITIDLSSFFTNPVEDLRTLLPYHTWTNKDEWLQPDVYSWEEDHYGYMIMHNGENEDPDTLYYFDVYDDEDVVVNFDESFVDSIVTTEWGSKQYYISQPINYHVYIDSSYYFDGLRLTNEDGDIIDNETIDEQIENGTFFPYFKDYTLNGMFPEMTREKWLDLLWGE
jgi:hypothetical protein